MYPLTDVKVRTHQVTCNVAATCDGDKLSLPAYTGRATSCST